MLLKTIEREFNVSFTVKTISLILLKKQKGTFSKRFINYKNKNKQTKLEP